MVNVLLLTNFMSFYKEKMPKAFSKPSLPSPTPLAWLTPLPHILALRFEYTSGVGVGDHLISSVFINAVHEHASEIYWPAHFSLFSFLEHLTCSGRLLGKSVRVCWPGRKHQRESMIWYDMFLFPFNLNLCCVYFILYSIWYTLHYIHIPSKGV